MRPKAHVAPLSDDFGNRRIGIDTAAWWLRHCPEADPVEDAIFREVLDSLPPEPEPDPHEVWMERYGNAAHDLLTPDEQGRVGGEIIGGSVGSGDPRDKAVQTLVLQVWLDVHKWRKQPKPEVIAAAIALAIAYATRAGRVKHPRDIAKEVHVRPQTLFRIRKVALAKIEEFGLAEELHKSFEKQRIRGPEGESY